MDLIPQYNIPFEFVAASAIVFITLCFLKQIKRRLWKLFSFGFMFFGLTGVSLTTGSDATFLNQNVFIFSLVFILISMGSLTTLSFFNVYLRLKELLFAGWSSKG